MVNSLHFYPSLYQINARVWLRQLSAGLGHPASLDEVPDGELDRLAGLGFDWIYLLGAWSPSPLGRKISLELPENLAGYANALPGFEPEDVCGSPFAITGYTVNAELGGEEALDRFRRRLQGRGLRLMLDFIPNHTARDHPWVQEHPEYYVGGTPDDLAQAPGNYGLVNDFTPGDGKILAFGRDPYFPGWSDTFQLNYGAPELQEAMREALLGIAALCDGVRCDMAMLILPQVFRRTWGIEIEPFWPGAIQAVRSGHPGFTFMAEVYWDLEWALQQQGFDFTYDKRLYDRLRALEARSSREHFHAGLDYQGKMVRFLENHDEPRAASTFPPGAYQAAALLTYLSPGLRFFHHGQLEGRKTHLPVQLCRGPEEAPDPALEAFYARLLQVLKQPVLREGDWQLLEPRPAWTGNWTNDRFIAFAWHRASGNRLIVAVNYCPDQGQSYIRLPFPDLEGCAVRLTDLMDGIAYDRDGSDLLGRGLYLDLPPWGYNVFELAISI